MAVVFAVRGDSLDARFSSEGKSPGVTGSIHAAVTTDEPGINGTNSIDMVGTGAAPRPLIYNGRTNTPSGLDRSILIRCKLASAASLGLINMGTMTRNSFSYLGLEATAGGEVTARVGNAMGGTDTGTTTGAALGTSAFKDILVTWDGTNGAGKLNVYVDATSRLSDTMSRFLPNPFTLEDQLAVGHIMFGSNHSFINAHMSVDEVVIWDEIIDPTSVTLTSGSGSLNGASRTAYVDVAEYDGMAASGGGGGGKSLGNRKGLVV